MTSAINPNVPVAGNPTTASVRANFATAQQEITTLQNNTQGAPFLPLAGAQMRGPINLFNDPTAPMHPVTLGYFLANGGGGGDGGGGGVPEAPADGTLYGRQDGAWQPAVTTDELNDALAAAPYLPIAGGSLTGMLTLSGPPTVALHPATKGYTDTTFVPLAGATMTGALILPGPPTTALGAATKGYIDASNFVSQIGASLNLAVVENTTGATKLPVLAGNPTPYNDASDGFAIAAKRLTAPYGSSGIWNDGPSVMLLGPSNTPPNVVNINAGNNAAGYKSWQFGANGIMTAPGNILAVGGNATLCSYDPAQGAGVGMYIGGGNMLYLASTNSNGGYTNVRASITSGGQLTVGYLGGDPLLITTNSPGSARIIMTVAGLRAWSAGTLATDATYTITDETGGVQRLKIGTDGALSVYSGGIRYPSVAYGSANLIAFGWATVPGYPDSVAVIIDSGGAVYPIASASDERMKHDLAPSSYDCLATLLELPLAQYRWSDVANPWSLGGRRRRSDAPLKRVGLIAQHVHKVFSEGVIPGDNYRDHLGRVWTLDQNNMIALLIGAVQQLTARVAAVEGR